MASPTSSPKSPRSLADLVTCPVCLDTYRDPKTLACLHAFCASCLENCRRPFYQDITCPICNRKTPLSPRGVMGLQSDFRAQQLQDILTATSQSATAANEETTQKMCDSCKSDSRKSPALSHCIQCYMYFCARCTEIHSNSSVFSRHHVISLCDISAADTLFCKTHRDHPVRYFCKVCKQLLCTLCTMAHDSSHNPEQLEKGIIEKYRQELQHSLKLVRSKLSEVNSKSKYLEVVRQAHQVALNEVQTSVRRHTAELFALIQQQEAQLLAEVQQKIDAKMLELGLNNLDEISLKKMQIEGLFNDVQSAIGGSPQQCLLAYENLVSRVQNVIDSAMPNVKRGRSIAVIKFVPSDDLNFVIGKLQEATIRNDAEKDLGDTVLDTNSEKAEIPGDSSNVTAGRSFCPSSPQGGSEAPVHEPMIGVKVSNRRSAMLSAMCSSSGQSSRKQPKFRKMKLSCNLTSQFSDAASRASSSTSSINADSLLLLSSTPVKSFFGQSSSVLSADALLGHSGTDNMVTTTVNGPEIAASTSASFSSSSRSETLRLHIAAIQPPKLLFSVSRTGGWTGKIESPQSVAFLPDGNIVLAECSNLAARLQVFDRTGASVRIMAWGQVQPYGIAIGSGGMIFVADRKERCVKVFSVEGVHLCSWQGRMSMPYAVTTSPRGNVVVTDTDSKTVTIFRADGNVVNQFGSWGSADCQFMQPSGVAVDLQENIYVSDTINQCVQVFDQTGTFIRRLKLGPSCEHVAVPDGITCDRKGRVLLCDRERNVISILNSDGRQNPLIRAFGSLRYPVAMAMDKEDRLAVIESHSGFLSPDQHCGLKVFQV